MFRTSIEEKKIVHTGYPTNIDCNFMVPIKYSRNEIDID